MSSASTIKQSLKQFRSKTITKDTRKKALKLTKRTLKTFVTLKKQDLMCLREVWTVIKDNIQPDADEDEDDPHESEQPDGILALAGLDGAHWDADDVWSMLYQAEPDVPGAIKEVKRLLKIIEAMSDT